MIDPATKVRAAAIEDFAAVLRELRDSVGTPSFRAMSGRSRAISHTTLHEAAQGHRLPSWATTAEFVKACGADPDEYRERWEQANRLIRSAGGADERAAAQVDADAVADEEMAAEASLAPRERGVPRRYALPAVAAAVAVAAVAVAVVLLTGSSADDHDPAGPSSPQAQLAPADCPVHQKNPPPAAPAHHGDASAFVADITLPDCSHLHRGETVTKVWRLKNIGTVDWMGYSLHRLDLPQQRDQCQTISDVPIADTKPGELVDIKTQVTAPNKPGFCFVRFKMVDAAGHLAFPGSRPVNFQLIIV